MFKHFLKIARRNMMKQKSFTAVNILGLTLGISACLIIFLITSFELSYDSFQPDKDRIFRVVSTFKKSTGDKDYFSMVPDPMAQSIRREFTGIEKVTEFQNYYAKVTIPDAKDGIRKFDAAKDREEPSDIIIADQYYFDIFKYQWLAGNAETMSQPWHVAITEHEARKYFGSLNFDQILGRKIIYDDSLTVFVSGIIKDYPANTDFNFRDFISEPTIQNSFLKNLYDLTNWQNWARRSQTFVKLYKKETVAQFETQAGKLVNKYMDQGNYAKLFIGLQPLLDIHFNDSFQDTYGRRVNLGTIYGLMFIGTIILLIAAINFINLSTAQSFKRAKEIGIRKVMGSRKSALTLQFLSETFIVTMISLALSLAIVPIFISLFHSILPVGFNLTVGPVTFIFLLIITILTCVLAGLYPAKVMASYLPIESLKGENLIKGNSAGYMRKTLMIFQFTLSLIFIICTLIIGNQIHYVLNMDLGFKKDAIINIKSNPGDAVNNIELFAQKVKQLPAIQTVSIDMGTPLEKSHKGTNIRCLESEDPSFESQFQTGDENYVPLYEFKLIAGRNVMASDTMKEFLINESCAKKLGFKNAGDAMGKTLRVGTSDASEPKKGPIVGVLADFHSQSLHEPIAPTFLTTSKTFSKMISIKLSTNGKQISDFKNNIAGIEKAWKEIYPNEKFEYSFFDESIAKFYSKDRKTGQVMNIAMTVAIFISSMGLFALAAIAAQQKRKEISIRKTLGASVLNIVSMLSKGFISLVIIAILIGSPIAYYFMDRWLQNFSYRINIGWLVFALAGLFSMSITVITISYQVIKAAIANPVKNLRSE